jgi:nicotinate-nucleotide--dimethylbenzimidazole phosphoribosyltransferase
LAYGMMAVEPGIDALAIGEMSGGSTAAAAVLCAGLFGGRAADWLETAAPSEAVEAAVARHRAASADPFDLLRRVGGLDLAAIAGAVLAARMGRVPVVLDGFAATAAAAVLHAADPRALDHCIAGHLCAEPGHRRLLERLGKPPLLDLGLRLGEAAGATLALSLLQAAVACHDGMTAAADGAAIVR